MFSQASSYGRPQFSAHLYHQVGVETGVRSASPHALTLMLYDGFLSAVKQARLALAEGRTEEKGRHVRHASRILDEGLKAALNLQSGGELALNLRDVYDYTQVRLMQGHARNDATALAEAQALIEPLREGWAGIAAQMAR